MISVIAQVLQELGEVATEVKVRMLSGLSGVGGADGT